MDKNTARVMAMRNFMKKSNSMTNRTPEDNAPVLEEPSDPLSQMLGPEKSTAFFQLLQKIFRPYGPAKKSAFNVDKFVHPFAEWDAEQKR